MSFNEARHPRKSEGTSQGGQFTNVVNSEQDGTLNGDSIDSPADVAARIHARDAERKRALRETIDAGARASAEYGDMCAENIAELVASSSPDTSRIRIERDTQDGYVVTYARWEASDVTDEDTELNVDAWASELYAAEEGQYFKSDEYGDYIDVDAWRHNNAPSSGRAQ